MYSPFAAQCLATAALRRPFLFSVNSWIREVLPFGTSSKCKRSQISKQGWLTARWYALRSHSLRDSGHGPGFPGARVAIDEQPELIPVPEPVLAGEAVEGLQDVLG